jgi:tRNA 2-thiocytidine biosynthesis protein TtcA
MQFRRHNGCGGDRMRWFMTDWEHIISKKIGRALYRYKMIDEGDKILVAVSGGKDSMTLLYHLLKIQRRLPINFHVGAVHIETDFCTCGKKSGVYDVVRSWGAECEVVKVAVVARLRPGRKMNCYWCSTQRRTELMKYASEKGYTKIALGHHMDDILETFLMNMMYKSELSTMLPVLKYDNYPHTVIRPLTLVKEREIVEFAKSVGIDRMVCTCPYGTRSNRKEARERLEALTGNADYIKDSMFKALSNVNMRYMPEADVVTAREARNR